MAWKYKDIDEKEFLKIIGYLAQQFGESYSFGIYDKDDIAQEIAMICLEPDRNGLTVLDKWDRQHSLSKFLSICVQSRLINLKRNKFFRATCPCKKCDGLKSGETKHRNKQYCKKFITWRKRNMHKCSLAAPQMLSKNYDDFYTEAPDDILMKNELSTYIDERLPVNLRHAYLRLKSGNKVTEQERQQVTSSLYDILKDSPYSDELEKVCLV
ncbi:MAG TPA: hypothetical protein VFV86_06280 [Nitrososphaeraceae archaeon]|nr:hypothetical protein [Nitrososphaeraceae archaeon]